MLYIAKHLKIRLMKYFTHMILAPIILILIAYGVRMVSVELLFENRQGVILPFLTAGFVYSGLVFLIIYSYPIFVGLSKDAIADLRSRLLAKLK